MPPARQGANRPPGVPPPSPRPRRRRRPACGAPTAPAPAAARTPSRAGDALPADQHALGLLDDLPRVQRALKLDGELGLLLALHHAGDQQRGQVGEGEQRQLALGRPGPAVLRQHRDHPDGVLVVRQRAGQHGADLAIDGRGPELRPPAVLRPGPRRRPAPCPRTRRCRDPPGAGSAALPGARTCRRRPRPCADAGRRRPASGLPRRRRTSRAWCARPRGSRPPRPSRPKRSLPSLTRA